MRRTEKRGNKPDRPSSHEIAVIVLAILAAVAPDKGGLAILGHADAATEPASLLAASPTAGPAPLAVSFKSEPDRRTFFGGTALSFGDAAADAPVCRPGERCGAQVITHTYTVPGTYIARLIGRGEGSSVILGSVSVTVE